MFELIIYIVIFVIIAGLIMIAMNIVYDLSTAIVPVVALLMAAIGVIVGFVVAIKNTILAYRYVYLKKGEDAMDIDQYRPKYQRSSKKTTKGGGGSGGNSFA